MPGDPESCGAIGVAHFERLAFSFIASRPHVESGRSFAAFVHASTSAAVPRMDTSVPFRCALGSAGRPRPRFFFVVAMNI